MYYYMVVCSMYGYNYQKKKKRFTLCEFIINVQFYIFVDVYLVLDSERNKPIIIFGLTMMCAFFFSVRGQYLYQTSFTDFQV